MRSPLTLRARILLWWKRRSTASAMQQVTAGFLCATGQPRRDATSSSPIRPFTSTCRSRRIGWNNASGALTDTAAGTVIPTYAIESTPGTITATWKDCLTEGFGVFDTSIASLQFAIDALLPELHDAAARRWRGRSRPDDRDPARATRRRTGSHCGTGCPGRHRSRGPGGGVRLRHEGHRKHMVADRAFHRRACSATGRGISGSTG